MQRVQALTKKYGASAFITYNVVGLSSLATCYTVVDMGVDTKPILDTIYTYIPSFKPEETPGSEDEGSAGSFTTKFFLAYALHKVFLVSNMQVFMPLRLMATASLTPLVAKRLMKFKGLEWLKPKP
jgi:hypothetical protein